MEAKLGARVIEWNGFEYMVKVITSRTANTIATSHLNGSRSDRGAGLYNFRAYDEAKVSRIMQLEEELEKMRKEQRELYQSLERLE